MSSPRFVVLVLDGLRPDLVTAELMPNLHAFREEASVLANSRAQFPTQTRVNKTSFATGTIPRHHGVLFNKMYDPALSTDAVVDIGDIDLVRRTQNSAPIVTATPVGAALASASKKLAVIHCGAPGAPWLLNFRADELGQDVLSMAGYDCCTPELAGRVEAKMGSMPSKDGVNLARSAFAVRAFTEVVYPTSAPDVTIIWSDEPDKSLHIDGLMGPTSLDAIKHVDQLVGDLVAWWRPIAARDNLHLLFLSDHGHSQTTRTVALGKAFQSAGLNITTDPREAGVLAIPMSSGGLYLRGQNPDLLVNIAAWMREQEWCGHLISNDADGLNGVIPGTFSKAFIGIDHPRAPDLFFTLRHTDDPTDPLAPGACFGMGAAAPQGSMHGGMHRTQMRTVAFAQGPAFKQSYQCDVPGGMIDWMPTFLDLLGIEQPASMVGRPLRDLYVAGGEQADADVPAETFTVGTGAYSQSILARRLTGRLIVEDSWTGSR